MVKPIIMPQIGQDIQIGILVEWKVKKGDYVNKGDIIAVVESEKAIFDLEAPDSGYIIKILVEAGSEVNVLEPIGYIGEKGEVIEDTDQKTHAEMTRESETSSVMYEKDKLNSETAKSGVKASPSARRLAKEHGIALESITASGFNNRIIAKDVIDKIKMTDKTDAIQKDLTKSDTEVLPSEDKEIPLSKNRQIIAERLMRSKQTIPHFYLFIDVDMTSVLEWRADYNQTVDAKISINDIIVKAAASAIKNFPQVNSHFIDGKIIQRKNINIGVAVSVEDGLMVPVIPDADRMTIQEINQLSQKNIESAKKRSLNVTEAGTFTISNLGMYEIDIVLPIINPPQCAILGVGSIRKKVLPLQDNTIGIRDYMKLSLACDHRVLDGAHASQFLNEIKNQLENVLFKD